jgi:predicted enzyme related to lactoylglutathione lyase
MSKPNATIGMTCAAALALAAIGPATAQTGSLPAAQIGRHTIYTADMEKSIAFWVEGFGYKVRFDNNELGGPVIEKSFKLKPGGKMRFAVLEPPAAGGLLVGLMSSVGEPFRPMPRDPTGAPQAGENFVLIRVPDVHATFAKLQSMGLTINTPPVLIPSGTTEGSVITPEGNRIVIQQAPK